MHQEMAVPEVNKNLLAELEEIGFSEARATRALHFSGNASIEAAINWIIDHENDADIDEMPLVPVDIPVEPSDLSHISEQVKLRAQQLRDQVRKNQEEEQKKLEKNREKERISAGKEVLKAKRMAEDNARKRYIVQYEADKEEKRKAMERIRQKLQQDKAERRRRLGLDVEASPKPANYLLHDNKNSFIDDDSVPVSSTKKVGGDQIRERLRSLRRQHMENDDAVRRAFQTLLIYIRNVSNNPEEEKFRKIRLSNPAFQVRRHQRHASINFLEDSTAYSSPKWSFRSYGGNLRYGTLPREAVCTENLTPWLKLLACRDKAGFSALMNRPSIYRGYYHSQRLRLSSDEFGSNKMTSGIVLDQTLTIVLQPNIFRTGAMSRSTLQPSWSLNSLFGRKINGKCVLSNSSNVYVQLEQNLLSELKKEGKEAGSHSNVDGSESIGIYPGLEISISPDRLIRGVDNLDTGSSSVLYEFPVENYSELKPFDLEFRWKSPLVWSCQQSPLRVSRYLMGSGNERGSLAISLKSNQMSDQMQNVDGADGCWLKVDIFQVVPWYVKVYYHTLKVFIDEKLQPLVNTVEKIHISPSEDKVSPGVLEMTLRLPCEMRSAALTLEFDKGFLHIDEYPPDANQGFDIPSAVVVFGDFQTSMRFADDSLSKISLLSKLQERNQVRSYTEVLLVPLTTPDFSMPYNVITITCTVFALYFGSLLNALRWRAAEEDRRLKSQATKKTGRLSLLLRKLFAKLTGKPREEPNSTTLSSSSFNYKLMVKILLVAGLAVAWQYYST